MTYGAGLSQTCIPPSAAPTWHSGALRDDGAVNAHFSNIPHGDAARGGVDVIATKLNTAGQRETCVVCRRGRMAFGAHVRDRFLADPDGLEVWIGTRTLAALVG